METTKTWLAHEDARVAAVLALAQFSAEYPAFDDAPLELAVTAMLPDVAARDAVNAFRLIAGDLYDAAEYDTSGGDAVIDRLGTWAGSYLSADEKATESRDTCRESARLAAAMLVSNQDALARKAAAR